MRREGRQRRFLMFVHLAAMAFDIGQWWRRACAPLGYRLAFQLSTGGSGHAQEPAHCQGNWAGLVPTNDDAKSRGTAEYAG
jgi:hypothetical protein